MSAGMSLVTDADLADEFGITVEKLHELRKRYRWPHVRLGRFDIRFTDEQVRQIVSLHSEVPQKRTTAESVKVPGQTAKSAARRRSA